MAPHRPLLRLLAGLVLWALLAGACASPTSALRFKRLDALEADETSILALLQDRQGFIWIGTHDGGLYRYNGYHAQQYKHDPRDPRSLPDDRVSALHEDRQGRLWVGTQDGLARFDPATGGFLRYAPPAGPPAQRIVKAIVGDGADGLWLATWGGLLHFDPALARFRSYRHDPADPASLASDDLNALALEPDGGLWVATWPAGLDHLAPGAGGFSHRRLDQAATPDANLNNVRALLLDPDRTLWIGTENGVLRWDSRSDWATRARLASPASRVSALHGGRDGSVWAATLTAGLLRWRRGDATPTHYRHRSSDPHSLPSDQLRAVLQDRGGMLWVGSFTDGIGLSNLNSAGFERFIPFDVDADPTHANNSILAIEGAPGGALWLGGNSGVSLFEPASGAVLRTHRAAPGVAGALSSDRVYSLYQQPGGPLWVGTAGGLNRQDRPDGPFRAIRFGDAASDFINAIAPGAGGQLWLGTGLQVIRYDIASGRWNGYRHRAGEAGSRSVNSNSTLIEDRRGRVWLGSQFGGGGLHLLDPASGQFRHFRHDQADPTSLADDNVVSLYEDAQGRIWVGTARGLDQLLTAADGAIRFRHYDGADSVGALKILALRGAADGALWLSTPTALLRLAPDGASVTRYRAADGLSDGFAVGAAYAAPDGVLYFGGAKGMSAVHPARVSRVSVAPQVALTEVRVRNLPLAEATRGADVTLEGSVGAPTGLTLPAHDSAFSLEFSALHYADPGRNRYAHRLLGFERDWIETDATHRGATYTNLDPGSYTFEVKAANEQGQWGPPAPALRIRIRSPYWQSGWFRFGATTLALGLLAGAYRWRVRRLTRRQQQLQALVAARTDELEQSNAKLATLSTTDSLTGITNRRGFDAALAGEWWRAKRGGTTLALAMLDVDHFKSYNDLYGHQAGDQCLRTVAAVIAACARRTSDLVARYGGEEFVLLAPDTDAATMLEIARGICAELETLALAHAHSPHGHVTISIGVAALRPDERGDTGTDLLVQAADRALYRAKQEGRNRAVLLADSIPAKIEATAPDSV
jgi:diguanylate cyclase (GGDEF)-like protein